jgi:hypothetical protein
MTPGIDDDVIPTAIVIKNIPFNVKRETLLDIIVRTHHHTRAADRADFLRARHPCRSRRRTRSTTTSTSPARSAGSPSPTSASRATRTPSSWA